MSRQQIRLKKGQEILVNGYVIRAVGLSDRNPEGLSVYHPNVLGPIEQQHDPLKALYAGQGDTVVCASVLSIGTVGNLIASNGYSKAIETAKTWVRDNLRYFVSNDEIRARAVEASKIA